MEKKKEMSKKEILEKLKWYHGEAFDPDILKDEFIEQLHEEDQL